MVTVRVEPPQVRGGRVRFRWQQEPANEFQRRDEWFVHYHGVPLARMDRRLLYDVLFSLQLPVWAAHGSTVTVVLPEPVPQVTLDFWRAYFDAPHVEFAGPVDPTTSYDVQGAVRPRRTTDDDAVAVTFGGGKDSTLAQQALLERRDPREVVLLHVVQLANNSRRDRVRATLRSIRTVLGSHWKRHRGAVQLVTTDYMGALRNDRPGPRPHINLHISAMLPALVHHGVHQTVFSRTALGYRVHRGPDGALRFVNPSGRPERLRRLGAYYDSILGWPMHVESTHQALGELVSFGTLMHEYPDAFARMVMCTRTLKNERFCHSCPKCLEFALFGLALGHVAPDLDYDRLLLHPRVASLVQQARAVRATTAWHGTGPYRPDIGTRSHFATWCHALHLLDPDRADLRLSDPARENLRMLREAWGRVPFPAVARLDARAVGASGPLGREVAEVAARVFPVVEPREGASRADLLLVGDRRAHFDFDAVMPTPALDAWAARWSTVVGAPVPPQVQRRVGQVAEETTGGSQPDRLRSSAPASRGPAGRI